MQRALLVALQPRIPALTLFSRLIPITPAYRCCAEQKSVGNKEKKRNAVMYRRRYIMLRTGEWRVGMVISVHDTMNPEANRRTFLRLPYTTITTSSLAIPTRKLLMSGQRKREPWSSFFWGTSRRLTVHSPNPPPPGSPMPLTSKESIWALYCRSMLLWCYTVGLREGPQPSGQLLEDQRADDAAEAWQEVHAIEDSLDAHKCNLDTGLMVATREYFHE